MWTQMEITPTLSWKRVQYCLMSRLYCIRFVFVMYILLVRRQMIHTLHIMIFIWQKFVCNAIRLLSVSKYNPVYADSHCPATCSQVSWWEMEGQHKMTGMHFFHKDNHQINTPSLFSRSNKPRAWGNDCHPVKQAKRFDYDLTVGFWHAAPLDSDPCVQWLVQPSWLCSVPLSNRLKQMAPHILL